MNPPVLVHGTRPLLRTVMEVGRDWALMSDGDAIILWRVHATATAALSVGLVVADHGSGRCDIAGTALAYREADEEGDMAVRDLWALAA